MKQYLAVILGAVVMASCGGGGAGLQEPTAATAQRAGVSLDAAGEGYWVFQRKCVECHEPRIPDAPLTPGWHATASGMAWNAGLSKAEEAVVLAYLQTAKQ